MAIDSHIHCGSLKHHLPYETIEPLLRQAGCRGASLFAPVEDIYDRYNPNFVDNDHWRENRRLANEYLLDVARSADLMIFPYFFVWNDFAYEELDLGFRGVKWHRHDYEPVYHYDDPRCAKTIERIVELSLPIVLEESYKNTLMFVFELAREATVIIPHMGGLNGGYGPLERAGVFRRERVYADTALASTYEMRHFLDTYGPERLIFGSDFPFSTPRYELDKVLSLNLPEEDLDLVTSGNILRLVGDAS